MRALFLLLELHFLFSLSVHAYYHRCSFTTLPRLFSIKHHFYLNAKDNNNNHIDNSDNSDHSDMTTITTTTTITPAHSIPTTISSSSSILSKQTDKEILLKTNKLLLEEEPATAPTTTAAVQQQQEGQQLEQQQQQQRPSFEPTFKYHHQIFGSRAPPKHVALTVVRPFMGDFYEKNKEGKEVITQEAFRFIVETSELVANTSAALSTATPPPLYGYQLEDNSQQPIMNNRFEFDPSLIAKINAAESRVDDDGNVIYRVEVDEDELASLYSTSSRDKLAAEEEYIRHYPELKDKREWRSSSRKKKQMRYRVNYWHQIKLSLAMMIPRLPVIYGRTWAVLLILGIYVPLVVTLLRTVIGLLPPIPLFLQRVWLFVELFVLLPVMINWACTKHPQDNKLRLGLLLFTWEKKLGWQMDRIRAWWTRGKTARNH